MSQTKVDYLALGAAVITAIAHLVSVDQGANPWVLGSALIFLDWLYLHSSC